MITFVRRVFGLRVMLVMPGISASLSISASAWGISSPFTTRQTMISPVADPQRIRTWRIRPFPVFSS